MSEKRKTAKEERRKNMIRIIALIACAALLLTAVLPFFVRG